MKREQKHEGADADTFCARGNRAQERKLRRRPTVIEEVMLTRPDMVEAEFFCQHAEIKKIPVDVLHRPAPWLRVAEHGECAEFHDLPLLGYLAFRRNDLVNLPLSCPRRRASRNLKQRPRV